MTEFLEQYGLLALAISLLIDDIGIPCFSGTFVFTAALLERSQGDSFPWIILFVSLFVPYLANILLFYWGAHGGKKWLKSHGRKFFLPQERIRKFELFFKKKGGRTIIFLSSIINNVRPIMAFVAGSSGMGIRTFLPLNFLGIVFWSSGITLAGYFFGEHFWEAVRQDWRFGAVLLIAFLCGQYFWYFLKAVFFRPPQSGFFKMRDPKKILVIGNGGREHVICEALARSPQKPKIYNIGSAQNPGIKALGVEIILGDIVNQDSIKRIIHEVKPDLVVIGPENPIDAGISDMIKSLGIPCFAPSKRCAQLESSKSFTRNLLKKHGINASPEFFVSIKKEEATYRQEFFDKFDGQIVVKADGLLGGKGVLVAGDHFHDFETAEDFAVQSIEKFGRVVLEEKLIGQEFSLISIVDGTTVLDCPVIQDNKRVGEKDTGPNTGGMGTISDENGSLPFLTDQDVRDAHEITVKTMNALEQELGEKYTGVMYGGFIATKNGVKLIEYNARFGDPEALNILSILESDFVEICEKACQEKLSEIESLDFRLVATVVKYLCANGYPSAGIKGEPIHIANKFLKNKNDKEKLYFFSILNAENEIVTKGGREVGVLGIGHSLEEANKNCEKLISKIKGPLFYRKDIGTEELMKKRTEMLWKLRNK